MAKARRGKRHVPAHLPVRKPGIARNLRPRALFVAKVHLVWHRS